jgi:hypothetical protein
MDSEEVSARHQPKIAPNDGVGALALRQVVDFIVGISLRGNTPSEQLAYLASPAGSVYLAAIAVFAIMPVLVNFRAPMANKRKHCKGGNRRYARTSR